MPEENVVKYPYKSLPLGATIAGGILLSVAAVAARDYEDFRKEIESANKDYKYISCTQGKAEHSEQLTYQEICDYGKECPGTKKLQMAYCRESLLSQCFAKKAWLTSNNFFGLPESVVVEKTSTHQKATMKNGKLNRLYLHCAYYN